MNEQKEVFLVPDDYARLEGLDRLHDWYVLFIRSIAAVLVTAAIVSYLYGLVVGFDWSVEKLMGRTLMLVGFSSLVTAATLLARIGLLNPIFSERNLILKRYSIDCAKVSVGFAGSDSEYILRSR